MSALTEAAAVLKVGSKVWVFNSNRRVYAKDGKGRSVGSPIWRKHWEEQEVLGETRLSWEVGYVYLGKTTVCHRLPKKDIREGRCPGGFALSEAHLDDLEWVQDHRWRVAQRVQSLEDAAVLREIAKLVNYQPAPKD